MNSDTAVQTDIGSSVSLHLEALGSLLNMRGLT